MDAHHCCPRQLLRRIAPELEWEPDNAILLTRVEHDAHERRAIVIPFEQLPSYVIRFAESHDLTMWLERYHPRRRSAES